MSSFIGYAAQQRKKLDSVLARLEKKYDNIAPELRERNAAVADIQQLVRNKIIDADHADILIVGVEKAYNDNKRKRAEREAPKRGPSGEYRYRHPGSTSSPVMLGLGQVVFFLWLLYMLFS